MKTLGNYLFFYSGPFSNWHPATFTDPINKITFANTEQHFMYNKANFFEDEESRYMIQYETDPKAAKALGRKVKNYDEKSWVQVRFSTMIRANYLKFSQNEDLKKVLLDTGNLMLVEASPYDKVWGIGLDLSESDETLVDQSNWKGSNLLGKALVTVRKLIRAEEKGVINE